MATVTEPGGKAVFFAAAQMWNDLADQAEHNDSTGKPRRQGASAGGKC
jgi:hypothetical protein